MFTIFIIQKLILSAQNYIISLFSFQFIVANDVHYESSFDLMVINIHVQLTGFSFPESK